jgi:SAM-dependent methyltransferase
MDRATLKAYDKNAAGYAQDWHEQPSPSDLHALVRKFFIPGQTADVGCGSGREVAWLNANGYPSVGYDASQGLLVEAHRRHPDCAFRLSALPKLDGIASDKFDNVLCETVIMHLTTNEIVPSVHRLLDILKPNGILYLSWRVTRDTDLRDNSERLYAAFDAKLVRDAMFAAKILLDEEVVSASSGKIIHRIVARK